MAKVLEVKDRIDELLIDLIGARTLHSSRILRYPEFRRGNQARKVGQSLWVKFINAPLLEDETRSLRKPS